MMQRAVQKGTVRKKYWLEYFLLWSLTLLAGLYLSGGMHINDGFWHVAMGRDMLATGRVPHIAIGAWDSSSFFWLPQEWLYDCIVAFFFDGHMELFCLFAFCCLAGTLFLAGIAAGIPVFLWEKPQVTLLYLYLGIILLCGFLTARPQTLSVLLWMLFFWKLRWHLQGQCFRFRDKVLFFVLVVFWANVHAGTVILAYMIPLFGVFGIWLFGRIPKLSSFLTGSGVSSREASRILSTIGCISGIAVFCTPNGILGFLYPYLSMTDNRMLSVVTEWASPQPGSVSGLFGFYIPVAFVLLWLLVMRRKLQVFDAVVLALMAGLGLLHFRMVLYLYPVLFICWMPYLRKICRAFSISKKHWFPGVCKVLGFLCFAMSVYQVLSFPHDTEGYGNTEFFETVKTESGDRLYNFYDIGSVLLYYDIPVFIDSRYDPYSDTRIEDFLILQDCDSCSEEVADVMDRYQFTSILDLSDSTAVQWAKNQGWKKVTQWNTGEVRSVRYGSVVPVVYEFWVPGS